MPEEEQGYLLDAASIRQLREDHEYLMAMAMVPSRRRLITRGGGGGGSIIQPYIITAVPDDNGNMDQAAIWPAQNTAISAKRLEAGITDESSTEDDITVTVGVTCGVTFTGCMIWVGKNTRDNTYYTMSAQGWHIFSGISKDEIYPGGDGEIDIDFINYFGEEKTATIRAVNDTLGITVPVGGIVTVEHINTVTYGFRISEIACPT